MGQTVDVKRKIYGISTFKNVVDVTFNQLVPKDAPVVVTKPTNVDDFFKSYLTVIDFDDYYNKIGNDSK
jgi:hypothetical protein